MHIEKHVTFEEGKPHITYSLSLGQYEAGRVASYIWGGISAVEALVAGENRAEIAADKKAAVEVMNALIHLAEYAPRVSRPPCLECGGQGRIAVGTTANKNCDVCRGTGRRIVASTEVSSDVN